MLTLPYSSVLIANERIEQEFRTSLCSMFIGLEGNPSVQTVVSMLLQSAENFKIGF
jgi:hypothetical protein